MSEIRSDSLSCQIQVVSDSRRAPVTGVSGLFFEEFFLMYFSRQVLFFQDGVVQTPLYWDKVEVRHKELQFTGDVAH